MSRLKGERGVSLIELLVVSTMLIVVLGAVLAIVESMMGNYSYQSRRIEAQNEARKSMVTMARAIRQAERPLLLPIYTPCNDLRFRADLNGDGTSEAIRYYLDASHDRIMRQETNAQGEVDWTTVPAEVLVSYVVNDPNNSAQAIFSLTAKGTLNQYNVRVISVYLLIDTNPAEPPSPVELKTDVQLRNFAQYQ